jgi:hypothetical protein
MTITEIEQISVTEFNEWCAYFEILEEEDASTTTATNKSPRQNR